MDGFDNQTNIIVMAATNRPDILDPALLRAGRFDRKVYVTSPTAEERTEIFNYYLKINLADLASSSNRQISGEKPTFLKNSTLSISSSELLPAALL